MGTYSLQMTYDELVKRGGFGKGLSKVSQSELTKLGYKPGSYGSAEQEAKAWNYYRIWNNTGAAPSAGIAPEGSTWQYKGTSQTPVPVTWAQVEQNLINNPSGPASPEKAAALVNALKTGDNSSVLPTAAGAPPASSGGGYKPSSAMGGQGYSGGGSSSGGGGSTTPNWGSMLSDFSEMMKRLTGETLAAQADLLKNWAGGGLKDMLYEAFPELKNLSQYYQDKLEQPFTEQQLNDYRANFRAAAAAGGWGGEQAISAPGMLSQEAQFLTALQQNSRDATAAQMGQWNTNLLGMTGISSAMQSMPQLFASLYGTQANLGLQYAQMGQQWNMFQAQQNFAQQQWEAELAAANSQSQIAMQMYGQQMAAQDAFTRALAPQQRTFTAPTYFNPDVSKYLAPNWKPNYALYNYSSKGYPLYNYGYV